MPTLWVIALNIKSDAGVMKQPLLFVVIALANEMNMLRGARLIWVRCQNSCQTGWLATTQHLVLQPPVEI